MKKIQRNILVLLCLFVLKSELFAIGPAQPSTPAAECYSGLLVDVQTKPPYLAPFHPDKSVFTVYVSSFATITSGMLMPQHALAERLVFQPMCGDDPVNRHLSLIKICRQKSVSHKTSKAEFVAANSL